MSDAKPDRLRQVSRRCASDDVATETSEVQWDEVVDVVCAGRGAGVLASAILAANAGAQVVVAQVCDVQPAAAADLPNRVGIAEAETQTVAWLDSVADSALLPPPQPTCRVLAASSVAEIAADGMVEPFVGARLRHWAGSCLASRYGLIYTGGVGQRMTRVTTAADGVLELAEVGEVDPSDADHSLDGWLAATARRNGIEVSDEALGRLIFDASGQVVGAVLATPSGGTRAVRARYGVVLSSGSHSENEDDDPQAESLLQRASAAGAPARVCVITRTASRFGQVGLLVDV